MSQFLLDPSLINVGERTARLTGEEAHHIARVSRVAVGEKISLFDGLGNRWEGVAAAIAPASVEVRGLTPLPSNEPLEEVRLVQALIKGERWEWLIEKAVELGVTRITPVISERSVVRPDEARHAARGERWRKIALGAAKQCERGRVPEVEPPVPLASFLKGLPQKGEGDSRLIFVEREPFDPPGGGTSGPVMIAIGPEGGWSASELEEFRRARFYAAGLGPRVLRSETAGIAALALLQIR